MRRGEEPNWGARRLISAWPAWTDRMFLPVIAVLFLVALTRLLVSLSNDTRPGVYTVFWTLMLGFFLLIEPWALRDRLRTRRWLNDHPERVADSPDGAYLDGVARRARLGALISVIVAAVLLGLLPLLGWDNWLYLAPFALAAIVLVPVNLLLIRSSRRGDVWTPTPPWPVRTRGR